MFLKTVLHKETPRIGFVWRFYILRLQG